MGNKRKLPVNSNRENDDPYPYPKRMEHITTLNDDKENLDTCPSPKLKKPSPALNEYKILRSVLENDDPYPNPKRKETTLNDDKIEMSNDDKEKNDPCPIPKLKKSSSALNEDKIDKFISESSKKNDNCITHAKKETIVATSITHGNKLADPNNNDENTDSKSASSVPTLKKETRSESCLTMSFLEQAKLSISNVDAGLFVNFSELLEIAFDSNNDILIENVKDMALRMLTPDDLKCLLNKLAPNFDKYITCGPIIEMFEYRKKWLRDYLENEPEPEFSWRMPHASIPGHPRVENFLKSDGKYLYYSIGFSLEYSRSFCFTFGNENNEHYSAIMSCSRFRAGKNARVNIKKTKTYFEKCTANYRALIEEYNQEIQSINMLLDRILI